jgi:protoporphyrinogen oxidase
MFCGHCDHEMSLAWMMWANGKPKLSTEPFKFWTLAGGVGRLTNILAEKLAARGATIMLDTEVRSLAADAKGEGQRRQSYPNPQHRSTTHLMLSRGYVPT